jgi:peptidoglycan/LPS O-acetylase OafA/YrhL
VPPRIPSLDGLRAISIVLLMYAHAMGTRGFPALLGRRGTPLDHVGSLGVRVFFVISGYLITHLLCTEFERTGTLSIRGFYERRAFRILPAYLALLAVIAGLAAAGHIALHDGDLLHALTFTTNFHFARSWYVGHTWSLSVEEQFYLLWPAAMLYAGRRRALRVALAALALAPLARVLLHLFVPSQRAGIGESFPTVADALAAGCLLTLARERLDASAAYQRLLRSPLFLLAPLFCAGSVFIAERPSVDYPLGQTVLNLSLALIVDRCVRVPDDAVGRLLNAPPLVFVGTLSYALYLTQQLFLNRSSDAAIASFPLNAALAVGAALLLHYGVESPFLRLRSRLRGAAKPARAT